MRRGVAPLAAFLAAATVAAAAETTLQDLKDKVSYSVGYQVGGDFKRQGQELNPEAMVRGVQDALAGTAPALSPEDMRTVLVQLKQKIEAAQQEERERISKESAQAGKAFLEENAKKEGVISLPSGLQYQVLQPGAGEKTPTATATVTVHYRGTLVDGTEVDSSYGRGQPATFPLDRVIKGWAEGIQLMKPGAKHRLFIPAALAYGAVGAGKIPPNSALIFEVELLSVAGAGTVVQTPGN